MGMFEQILGEIQIAANDFTDLHMRWNAGTRSVVPTLHRATGNILTDRRKCSGPCRFRRAPQRK
jgi:hypothetical protein